MSKSIIYFEELSLWSVLCVVFRGQFARNWSTDAPSDIYYIDTTSFLEKRALPFLKKHKVKIKKLDFKMMDIVDEAGELVRIRLPRKDLFHIQKEILDSEYFKSMMNETWQQDSLMDYIAKGVVDVSIMNNESASRVLFIIFVVRWHMDENKYNKSQFVVKRRPWFNIYSKIANKHEIELFAVKDIGRFFNKRTLHEFIRFHPKLYAFLKNIKYQGLLNRQEISFSEKHMLYVDGRGDTNLNNDGEHSDFFWHLNSDFPSENILYKHLSDKEESYLKERGVVCVPEGVVLDSRYKRNYTKPKLGFSFENKKEQNILKTLIVSYDLDRCFWSSFFKTHGVKLYFTWYKYSKDHIAITDAVADNGGISILWQMGFEGYEDIGTYVNFDISFCFSSFSHEITRRLDSCIKYTVITGYPKDYAPALVKDRAREVREQLQANGAEKIVFVIDENSADDDRWHTGHTLQQDNYRFILEKVLETPWLGVIFKPKRASNLRKRLGPVDKLLCEAEETGRCYIYESSGRHTTSAPPILAGLSADLCIHGHLSAGTAALECALEGLPTLLIDREGTPFSKLNELPKDKVIFKDWPSAIDAVMEHFSTPGGIPDFGDWSSIINELDPFRDGLAAKRIGDYLHWLIQGYDQGLDKETVMENAAVRYRKLWGDDKVLS